MAATRLRRRRVGLRLGLRLPRATLRAAAGRLGLRLLRPRLRVRPGLGLGACLCLRLGAGLCLCVRSGLGLGVCAGLRLGVRSLGGCLLPRGGLLLGGLRLRVSLRLLLGALCRCALPLTRVAAPALVLAAAAAVRRLAGGCARGARP
ncbi:MAG TPA: hypothetical protein VHF51_17345 [Solirubrobacteraceae bacterium]|nr:hypothetical protein [Solirubrobacteraceae bacterium]